MSGISNSLSGTGTDVDGQVLSSKNLGSSDSNVFADTSELSVKKSNPSSKLANNSTKDSMASSVQTALKSRYMYTLETLKSGGTKFGIASFIWFLGYFNFSIMWLFCGVCLSLFVTQKARKRRAATNVTQTTSDDPRRFVETVKEMYQLNGKHIPSWIYFPDVEKAEWLNKILQQMWPYVGNYVKNLLTDKVQSSIQRSSSLLYGFSFTDVDLGERAPRVTGIKVYGDTLTRRNEIVMDMQIVHDSDCNIGVSVNRLQAGIRNLQVRGLLRVELRPLIEKMPLVGAVSAAFVKDPTIDFDLTHLANIFDFPGFDMLLRGAILDTVASMFVLPEKYIVKLCPDVDISLLRFPLPKGLLRIHVLDAKNLEEKDKKILGFGGGSDPYVEIKGVHIKVGHRHKFKTRIIQHSINPVWNESFDVLLNDIQYPSVEFTLYDDDGALNKADYLGCAKLPVRTVFERGVVDETIQLSEVSTGVLHVRLEWFDLSSDPSELDEALKIKPSSGIAYSSFLNIYVDSAQHLPDNEEESLDPSPLLKICVPNGEPMKTKVVPHTNNPVWEENFHSLLPNPRHDEITFELKDKQGSGDFLRYFDKVRSKIKEEAVGKLEDGDSNIDGLGVLRYPIERLLREKNMTVERPFRLQNSGPNSELNLRLSLRILKLKKATSTSKENVTFIRTSRTNTDERKKGEDTTDSPEKSPTKPASGSDTHSGSNISAAISSGSLEFEGSPMPSRLRNESFRGVDRSPSVGSEMSSVGAVENLRKRLNAKLNNNTANGEAEKKDDFGLGRIQITLRYRQHSLIVLIVKAENLIVCDEDELTSDPYVRVYIEPHKGQRKKTKVVKNNLNPVFDQKLVFDVSAKEVSRKKLRVTVKNQTGFLSLEKTLMGEVIIDLSGMDLTQPVTQWYPLTIAS